MRNLILSGVLSLVFFISFAQQRTDILLNKLQAAGEDTVKVAALNELCWEYKNINPEKALKYGMEALELAKELLENSTSQDEIAINKKGVATSLNNIGVVHDYQGNYDDALNYYLQAQKINEELNDRISIATSLNNIGVIYYYLGNDQSAIDSYLQALEIRKELSKSPDPVVALAAKQGVAGSLNNIGLVYLNRGSITRNSDDYDKAIDYFMQSLEIKEELEDSPDEAVAKAGKQGIARSLSNIGMVYKYRGDLSGNPDDYEKVVQYYLDGLEKFEELGDKKGMVINMINIGEVYSIHGKNDKAIEQLEKSLDIAEEIGAKSEITACFKKLSALYQGKNNLEKALEYQKLYSQMKDSVLNEESGKQIIEMQTKYESEKKEKQIEIQTLELSRQELKLKKNRILRYALIIGLGLALSLAFLLYNRYRIKQKANAELSSAYDIIAEKNEAITDSIEYAKTIQQAIMPKEEEMKEALPGHFVFFQPREIVSGDFYWFKAAPPRPSPSDSYREWRAVEGPFIAACDCTGHGVPGAFVSMIGNDLLNQIIIEKNVNDPGEILSLLNNGIKSVFTHEDEQEAQDGIDMALCHLSPALSEGEGESSREIPFISSEKNNGYLLQFAGANNPLYIIRMEEGRGSASPGYLSGRDENKEINEQNNPSYILQEIMGDRQKIGGKTEFNYNFTTHKIELQKGDTIYIFTDGYTDQFNEQTGRKFSTKRFKELLLSIQSKSMHEQKEIVSKTINEWKGKEDQIDDMLVIGIKV
ncbi:MAG: tetratricopeptide repeat protein [Bacteroidota bacterium]